jgi:hypothetical protein
MKFIFVPVVAALLSLSAYHAQAQQLPDLPGEKELRVKEDYAKYEPLVKDVADWLEETDLDKQTELRQAASRFILTWVMGSPTVTIVFTDYFVETMKKNPPLYVIYMARYASYCISNNSYQDQTAPMKAGLTAIANVYKKGIAIKKTKALEKLVSAIDQDKLDDYVKSIAPKHQ